MDNAITMIGNVTRNPEIKYTDNGTPVANLAIAVNRRWTNKQGDTEEAVTFVDITAWRELGLNTADSITKGNRIVVSGRLDQNSWETPEGEKRSRHQITADDIAPSLKWATTKITKTIREEKDINGTTKATATEEEPF